MEEPIWYILKVVGGQENKVKQRIDQEVKNKNLENIFLNVIVPSEKIVKIHSGKRVFKERGYFSGYVFMCMSVFDISINQFLRNISGTLGFLKGGGWSFVSTDVLFLQKHEIDSVFRKVNDGKGESEAEEKNFFSGDSVKIIGGPFNDFIGTVREVLTEKKKLSVTVKIFERNTPVELSYSNVEKYSSKNSDSGSL